MSVFEPILNSLKSLICEETFGPLYDISLFLLQNQKKGGKLPEPSSFNTTLTIQQLEEDFILSGGVELLVEFVRTGDEVQYDAAMSIMNYFMRFFPRLCEKIGTNTETIQNMVKQLHPTPNPRKMTMEYVGTHTVAYVTTVNLRLISGVEETREVLINNGVLDAAKEAIDNKKESEISAILLMANLVGSSSETQKTTPHLVASEQVLDKIIFIFKTEEYNDGIVPLFTLLPPLRRLSLNDFNKAQLVKRGIVPIWVSKFPEIKQDESTLYEMLGVMSNLSQLSENCQILVEGGVGEILKGLSADVVLTEKHKKLIELILRRFVEIEIPPPPSGSEPAVDPIPVVNQTAAVTNPYPTLMISYNWDNQPIVKEIVKRLRKEGYSVWLDLDEMVGSSVETMANAVETSHVVLVCMSRRYKESPNCRLEGEYAFQTRKVIIPLLMQPQYKADGWLGAIVGTKIYYQFTHIEQLETGVQGLLKELEKLGQLQTTTASQSLPGPTQLQQLTTPQQPPTTAKFEVNPISWDIAQVGDWLESIGFGNYRVNFLQQEIDGKGLAFLTQAIQNASPIWVIAQPGGALGFNTIGKGLLFLFELKKLFSSSG